MLEGAVAFIGVFALAYLVAFLAHGREGVATLNAAIFGERKR